jgi:hypothetical protein
LYAAVNANDYEQIEELAFADVYPLTAKMLFKHVHEAREDALRLLFIYKRGMEALLTDDLHARAIVIDALGRQAEAVAYAKEYTSLAGGRMAQRVRRSKRSTVCRDTL